MTLNDDLKALGLENLGDVHHDLTTPQLYEEIVENRGGRLAHMGAVVVRAEHDSECSLRDVYIVPQPGNDSGWAGSLAQMMSTEVFDALFARVCGYMHNRDLYVQDCCAAVAEPYRVNIRFLTEMAWHSLFARTLYWPHDEVGAVSPDFTVIHVPRFQAIPDRDGTASSAFVAAHFGKKVVLIGGTSYGGEIRRAVSTICRSIMVKRAASALPLRCAVNVGEAGDVAAFLGRTGTGKTALAADPTRAFAGDHEHLWSADGLFPQERGCYARVLDLESSKSPAINESTRRFGAILENVVLDQRSRRVDYADGRFSQNSRALFPRSHLPNSSKASSVKHPRNVFLLTRDNLGVLPPIARLNAEQTVFAFLTSYVSSLAETASQPGDVRPTVQAEAAKKISLALKAARPGEYAKRFMAMIEKHGVRCWFLNTGCCGEPMERTERIDLNLTRTLVKVALSGGLDGVQYEKDPLFQFEIPKECPGVDAKLLDPRANAADEGEYELRANRLALDFIKGFERFELEMPESVREMVAAVPIFDDDLDIIEQVGFSI